jgi:ankyrin repeat protein
MTSSSFWKNREGFDRHDSDCTIYDACEKGEVNVISAAFHTCNTYYDYNRALSIACEHGRARIVSKLLEVLPEYSFSHYHDERGRTALHKAVQQGHQTVVKLLLENENTLELNETKDKYGKLPIHYACQYGYGDIATMLWAGLEWNGRFVIDDEGKSPLHYACATGRTDVVKSYYDCYLQDSSPDDFISIRDQAGRTCLDIACENGRLDTIALILSWLDNESYRMISMTRDYGKKSCFN